MRIILEGVGLYTWVDTDNNDMVLSPYFDSEEEAIQWYKRVAEIMFDEFGVKNERTNP